MGLNPRYVHIGLQPKHAGQKLDLISDWIKDARETLCTSPSSKMQEIELDEKQQKSLGTYKLPHVPDLGMHLSNSILCYLLNHVYFTNKSNLFVNYKQFMS